jgi:dipeptidase E
MPKLYLLGGENVFKRSAKQVNASAFEEAGKSPSILVFPWARASFDKRYRKRKILSDYFYSLGANNVEFIEYDHSEDIAKRLAASDIAYLTGGLPSVLIERLKNMGIDQLLKDYKGIIIGRSAGALALCKKCVTTCRSNSRVKLVSGLGLVDITLKAHYTPEKDEVLKRFSVQEKIFAVPQGSALVYCNKKLSAIGNVYLFNNGERETFSEHT